ncbi:DEAD/DEAH box helicase family protein [bacterium]|nr:DEAD/DEAH box helicase family protein [bacterium]
MNKKELSERDICTKYITPALTDAGWDIRRQIREEVAFTAGRIRVKGKLAARGKKKRADYILYYKPNIPLAVVEAKKNNYPIGAGIQQALDYAESLDILFAYSSNGDGFLEHDSTVSKGVVERELALSEFPSPEQLWARYTEWKKISNEIETIIKQDYHYEPSGKSPRYYQRVAINRVIEAIAAKQQRILLVMATGTGKTYTAFQIIWRLWKAGIKKRILFLADRNILVDQTMTNDFKHFGDKMTKITHRRVDKSYEVYLALYQALSGVEERKNIYTEFSPGFFDLVVVDECHRGSAAEDSEWREILEYFSEATQIGMTATPKETRYVSNIDYFGEPIYVYSLKQGIEDGFLAPYKVVRIFIDKDLEGWRPPEGKLDKYGREIEARLYNLKDYDRSLVIDERTQLVAKRISDYLKQTDRLSKTIVFCEDIDHAERMRHALINENADLVAQNYKYVMKITGDDRFGKQELDNFIDPEETHPVIATTSRLMSTGVDSQTCRLIVIDKNINSMTEFKQLIGRGTRVREDFNKMYFTIMDFRNATRLFYDPQFDGEPVQVYEPEPDASPVPPEEEDDFYPPPDERIYVPTREPKKYYVDGVPVEIIAEQVQYYDKEGGLVTVSLQDFTRQNIHQAYASLDNFLTKWNQVEQKSAIIDELAEHGVFIEELQDKVDNELDPFDLICHIAFDMPPLTRRERATNVKKRHYFAQYGDIARQVLGALLDKYADEGIEAIEEAMDNEKIVDFLRVPPFANIGLPVQIIREFGGKQKYLKAVKELEEQIYQAA